MTSNKRLVIENLYYVQKYNNADRKPIDINSAAGSLFCSDVDGKLKLNGVWFWICAANDIDYKT